MRLLHEDGRVRVTQPFWFEAYPSLLGAPFFIMEKKTGRAAMYRLEKLWPVNQPPGLVWGDSRLGNIMFDENFDVAAVMDWEQPSLGGALHDLAWRLVLSDVHHAAGPNRPFFEGMGTCAETIALWQELAAAAPRARPPPHRIRR
jgi:aminoglycoside phosphotransferase (APT) family kinase protein